MIQQRNEKLLCVQKGRDKTAAVSGYHCLPLPDSPLTVTAFSVLPLPPALPSLWLLLLPLLVGPQLSSPSFALSHVFVVPWEPTGHRLIGQSPFLSLSPALHTYSFIPLAMV